MGNEIILEQLMKSRLGDKIGQAMGIFEKLQKNLYALSNKHGEEKQLLVKAVTVMTFSLLNKFSKGKRPSDLTSGDWKEIANEVSEYAILQDEQKYTMFVFWMYERYIRDSVEKLEGFASEESLNSIRSLADELHEKGQLFNSEEIGEVKYIEDCLWICLEAMIKLIGATSTTVLDKDYAEFAQAVSAYAFEYGRFKLYKRELELVNEFVQLQCEADEKLEQKYQAFLVELKEQSKQFYMLIDNAFAEGFRENFLYSIAVAQAAGVNESEILTDLDVIDDFFMD